MSVVQILPQELKRRLDAGEPLQLLDVREPWEVAIASVPGSLHIPMNAIPERLAELKREQALVVLCKVGGRSQRVAQYLLAQGFEHVANLAGGIDAWTCDVDPSLESY